MIKNYFTIAWRNLKKNRAFSAINVLGLAIGMASTMFIMLWVQDEMSWNKFQPHYQETWQVYANRNFNGEIVTETSVILPLGEALEKEVPAVKYAAFSSYPETHVLGLEEKKLKKTGYRASSHYFNIFSWEFVSGNAATALSRPDAIILTQSSARAFFGDTDPLNKILRLDNQFDVTVTGVIRDVPSNSSMNFDFITPFNHDAAAGQDWTNSYTSLFIRLDEKANPDLVTSQINEVYQRRTTNRNSTYFIHPMSKWRLYSDFKDGKNTGGMIEYIRLFIIIAIVILLIACVNFMNLSTARSEKRAKEVGIRKTLGSDRKQLIFQFFFESMTIALIAFLIAVLLVVLLMPAFNTLVSKQLPMPFRLPGFWISAGVIIIFSGLFAGSYPALYLSSFNPVKVLKGTFIPARSALLPRKFLVVGQFVISILLISATLIVYLQIRHVKSRDLGYNPSNLISIAASPEANRNFAVIRQEMLNTGLVNSSTRTSAPLTEIWNFTPAPDYEGKPQGANMIVTAMGATEDFIRTTGIRLIAGRDFSGTPADSTSMLLNEAAVKTMGLKDPLGMKMRRGDRTYTVIGITANMVMDSPFRPVDPMMILYRPFNPGFINVRLADGADPAEALNAIARIFKVHNPSTPFEYNFIDEQYNQKFLTEDLISRLTNIFAGLAIFICCIGLSGLAAYTIHKRFREIGIRKVLGASVRNLLMTLSGEFLLLVVIAMCIAIPLSWWGMQNWLQKYEYRVDLSIWIFILAGVAVLALTILTVCLNALKAVLSRPVKSLRVE